MVEFPLSTTTRNTINIKLVSDHGSANSIVENVYMPILIANSLGINIPESMVDYAHDMLKQYINA